MALALATRGVAVTLIEGRTVAEAASGRNAGFLLAGLHDNFAAAVRTHGVTIAAGVLDVSVRNQQRVRELVRAHAIACDLAWHGSDLLALDDDDEWSDVRRSVEMLGPRGIHGTLDEAGRRATFPADGEVHPVKLARGIATAAERSGARIFEHTIARTVEPGLVRLANGVLRADHIVLCTNAYTPHLLEMPVRPVRGQMLATAPVTRRVFVRPVYAKRGFQYWRQTADGRIIVGGWRDTAVARETGEDETPTNEIQGWLDVFLREHAPEAAVTHRWAGTMAFSGDGLPYAGRVDDRTWVLAGCTGHGMSLFVELAHLLAAAVMGRAPADLGYFDPLRGASTKRST